MGNEKRHHVHRNDELLQTVYDLSHYHITIISDDDDDEWNNVVEDAQTYVHSRITRQFQPGYTSPFVKSERPDIIYSNNRIAMGIECFQFDASNKVRGGSTQEKKESQISRSHIKEYQQEDLKARPLSYKTPINPDYSLSHYIDSFLNTFNRHAEKISEYRSHVQQLFPDKEILVTFFIEDITSLGCYMRTSNGTEPVYPLRIEEILNAVKKAYRSIGLFGSKISEKPTHT